MGTGEFFCSAGTDNDYKIYIYNAFRDFTLQRITAVVQKPNNIQCEYHHVLPHLSVPPGAQVNYTREVCDSILKIRKKGRGKKPLSLKLLRQQYYTPNDIYRLKCEIKLQNAS